MNSKDGLTGGGWKAFRALKSSVEFLINSRVTSIKFVLCKPNLPLSLRRDRGDRPDAQLLPNARRIFGSA